MDNERCTRVACDYEAPMQMLTTGKKCIQEAVKRILSLNITMSGPCVSASTYTQYLKNKTLQRKNYTNKKLMPGK